MAGRGYRNTSQYGGPNDSKSDPRFGGNYDQQQQHGQQQSQRGLSNVTQLNILSLLLSNMYFCLI